MIDHTIVDYVWIGGDGELRSKTRIIHNKVKNISDIPSWSYDGSQTNQSDSSSTQSPEIFLSPKRIFWCPFRKQIGIIALCDTYTYGAVPIKNNFRFHAEKIFSKHTSKKPWFGFGQEYYIFDNKTKLPISNEKAEHYCAVGGNNVFGRFIVEEHLESLFVCRN